MPDKNLRSARVAKVTEFTIFSRSYCHLCDEMLTALLALREEFEFTTEVVDVDADPLLVERYNEWVPVLMGRKEKGEAVQLCHYFLEPDKVREFLHEAPPDHG